ncbi:unnamed protein product [Urochloa humidicola]
MYFLNYLTLYCFVLFKSKSDNHTPCGTTCGAQRARERPAGVAVDMHNVQQLLEKMLPRIRWDLIASRDQNIHDVSKYVEHLQTAKFAKANKVKLKFLLPRLRYRVPL